MLGCPWHKFHTTWNPQSGEKVFGYLMKLWPENFRNKLSTKIIIATNAGVSHCSRLLLTMTSHVNGCYSSGCWRLTGAIWICRYRPSLLDSANQNPGRALFYAGRWSPLTVPGRLWSAIRLQRGMRLSRCGQWISVKENRSWPSQPRTAPPLCVGRYFRSLFLWRQKSRTWPRATSCWLRHCSPVTTRPTNPRTCCRHRRQGNPWKRSSSRSGNWRLAMNASRPITWCRVARVAPTCLFASPTKCSTSLSWQMTASVIVTWPAQATRDLTYH